VVAVVVRRRRRRRKGGGGWKVYSKAKVTDEVDAGRDRATPASLRRKRRDSDIAVLAMTCVGALGGC